MIEPLRWKFDKHKDLVSAGINHNIVRDTFSRRYRDQTFNTWKKYPFQFAQKEGCFFAEETPGQSLKEVFVEGIYNVEGFLPKPGSLVVDVGANYGDSSVWYAKCFEANVVAFEPLKEVYEILQKNIALNKLNIVSHNVALGNGKEIKGSTEGTMFVSDEKEGNEIYTTSMLDDYSLSEVQLLKIDVEGFEYEVLEGGLNTIRKSKPRIILETHSSQLKVKCNNLLTDLGYTISHHGRVIKSNNPGMDHVQNIFYSPQVL